MTKSLAIHPAANCFRLMRDDELADLVADIEANGLRDPITLGRINGAASEALIDGRNRLRACEIAGVEPRFETLHFEDDDEVRAFVQSRSARRDLTKGERAAAIALLFPDAPMGRGDSRDGRSDVGLKYAETAHISKRRIQVARQVGRYSRTLLESVRDGIKKLDEALELVKAEVAKLETSEERLTRLNTSASDLAELVHEDRMTLDDAIAALDAREHNAKAEEASYRETYIRVCESAYRAVMAWSVPGFGQALAERLKDDEFRETFKSRVKINAEDMDAINAGADAFIEMVAGVIERNGK